MSRAALLAVTAVILASSACSSSPAAKTPARPKVIDSTQVETALVTAQKRMTPDLSVSDPSCPARIVVTEGATFPCTLALEGVIVPYTVTLSNVAKQLQYNIAPTKAILLMSKLTQALEKNLPGSKIDCGTDTVKVLDVGATFGCTVTDSKGNHPVTLRVNDLQGDVSQV